MEYYLQHHGVKGQKWGIRKKRYSRKDIHKEINKIGRELFDMRMNNNIYDQIPNKPKRKEYKKRSEYKKAKKQWRKDTDHAIEKYEKKWDHLGKKQDRLNELHTILKDADTNNDFLIRDLKEYKKFKQGKEFSLDLEPEDTSEAHINLLKMRINDLQDSKEYQNLHKNYRKVLNMYK